MTDRMTKVTAALFIIFVAAGESLAAASLLNYESRVVRATEQVKRIRTDAVYEEEGISTIRSLLPHSEEVKVEGRTVTVDHRWLHDLLDSYEMERDKGRRLVYLHEVEDRLRALDKRLLNPQGFAVAETATSDPRGQVREILSRPQFQPRKQNPIAKFLKEVWNSIVGFLRDTLGAIMRIINGLVGGGGGGNLLAIIFIAALLLAAAYGAFRVLRGRAPRRKRAKKRTVLGEEIEAGATALDLAEAAMAAAARGEFRRAMRGLYIALLYDMSERKLVELDDSATNREYLARVSRFNRLVAPMRYLTDRFDYFWYGMFPSTEADFSSYLARYKEAAAEVEQLGRQSA